MATERAAPASPGRATPLSRDQVDPLRSQVLRRELPGLAAALDEEGMRGRLQALMFGDGSPHRIERCNPGQAIYLGGDFCGLRYELELRDGAGAGLIEPLVIGRVFRRPGACRDFMGGSLDPVVALARGRADLAPYARLAAPIEPLNMVVHAFPVDGELPRLLDVTDPARTLELLRPALPARFTPERCRVELAHYGRRHRCTLRYVVDGSDGAGAPVRQTIYGKLTADGSGERAAPALTALREQLGRGPDGVHIPRVLGYLPDLQLLLLEAIPGRPQVARLLKARLAGLPPGPGDPLGLADAMGACGRIAAALHGAPVALGPRRALEDELGWLQSNIGALGRVSPHLGARLQAWLRRAADAAGRSEPLPPGLAHGDFTYTQIIFDGRQVGLVDFDTVCQAEPALDLGQFLAYQRLAIRKDQRPEAPLPAEAAEQLCAGFLEGYLAAGGGRAGDPGQLAARVQIYEILMLLRLAVHSWQKLKVSRLERAVELIEERIVWLP